MILQKGSYGHLECISDHPAEQLWKKAENFSRKVKKRWQNHISLLKFLRPIFFDTKYGVFTNLPAKFSQKAEKKSIKFQIRWKIFSTKNISFFIKTLFWTLGMQFWQTICLTENGIFSVHSRKTIKNRKF